MLSQTPHPEKIDQMIKLARNLIFGNDFCQRLNFAILIDSMIKKWGPRLKGLDDL